MLLGNRSTLQRPSQSTLTKHCGSSPEEQGTSLTVRLNVDLRQLAIVVTQTSFEFQQR